MLDFGKGTTTTSAGVPSSAPETPAWVQDAVFYQIFPDRFAKSDGVAKPEQRLESWDSPPTAEGFKGGDLLGVMERLDHLGELGVNAIYLNPIFASASNHRYHAYDYYAVDPLLGGNQALRSLLDAAHDRGIRVILDGVFNHCGRGFWPFHHIMETGAKSPYLDWFNVKGFPMHAYSDNGQKPNYDAWWGLPALPKLNVANPDTRAYLLDVAEYWIRFGADGWRLDVPHEIDDVAFWRSFRQRVRSANPDAYLVGEIWHKAPEWLEGDRFDALMNYPLSQVALGFFAGKTLQMHYRPGGYELKRYKTRETLAALADLHTWYHPNVVYSQLNLLNSHDTPRFVTMAGGDLSAFHLATLMQMTLPGAPCIYYGDEIGLEGGPDPDCRRAFPWEKATWQQETWQWTKQAVALRRGHPVLRQGSFEPVYGHDQVLAYLRRDPGEALLIVFNAGREPATRGLPMPEAIAAGVMPVDLWGSPAGLSAPRWEKNTADGGATIEITLPPRSARVLSLTVHSQA